MSTTLTISDKLAAALEAMRRATGMPSINAVAEVLLANAIAEADGADLGLSSETIGALIKEAEASGPAEPWDSKAVREEVLCKFATREAK